MTSRFTQVHAISSVRNTVAVPYYIRVPGRSKRAVAAALITLYVCEGMESDEAILLGLRDAARNGYDLGSGKSQELLLGVALLLESIARLQAERELTISTKLKP